MEWTGRKGLAVFAQERTGTAGKARTGLECNGPPGVGQEWQDLTVADAIGKAMHGSQGLGVARHGRQGRSWRAASGSALARTGAATPEGTGE